jgi:molecular chaperone GrpE
VPAGTVVQVVQAGYTIGERVLRPALVAVSKGGAKTAPGADITS